MTLLEVALKDEQYIAKFLGAFTTAYFLVVLVISIFLILISRYFSHKIAGPVYAFIRFLRETLNGERRKLKLRPGDEFLELEGISAELLERFEAVTPVEGSASTNQQSKT